MINEAIKKYVANQRASGFSDASIKEALIAGGWSSEDIAELLDSSTPASAVPPAATQSDRQAASAPKQKLSGLLWLIGSILLVLIIVAGGLYMLYRQNNPATPTATTPQPTTTNTPTTPATTTPQPTTNTPKTPTTNTPQQTITSTSSTATNNTTTTSTDISTYAQSYYASHNNSYNKLCTDPTVVAFIKHLGLTTGHNPSCESGILTYRVTQEITPHQYNCFDSTGIATTVSSLPTSAFLCLPPK